MCDKCECNDGFCGPDCLLGDECACEGCIEERTNDNKVRFDQIKELLRKESGSDNLDLDVVSMTVILHNPDVIILQMYGWSINLYPDGTYIWEATDGG